MAEEEIWYDTPPPGHPAYKGPASEPTEEVWYDSPPPGHPAYVEPGDNVWTDGKDPKQAVGPLLAFGAGLNPFNDEMVAAGTSVLDAWSPDINIGDTYNQRLAETRGIRDQFKTEHPNWNTALNIAGAVKTPILGIAKKIGSSLPVAANKIQALLRAGAVTTGLAAEGGAIGGLYGFGEGEGSFADRAVNAVEGAESGAKFGALVGGPLTAASELITQAAPAIKKTGQDLGRFAIGARSGNYRNSVKDLGIADVADDIVDAAPGELESKMKSTLDRLIDDGTFGKTVDPQKNIEELLGRTKVEATKLRGLLKEADDAGVRVLPQFSRALNYIEKGGIPASQMDDYLAILAKEEEAIGKAGKGSVLFLQEQKKALQNKWKSAASTKDPAAGFYRAMYTDIKETLESVHPEIQGINKKLQDYKTVLPIIQHSMQAKEGVNWIDKAYQMLRTSGARTVVAPIIAAAATGVGGLPALAAMGAGGLAYVATPAGTKKVSDALKAIAAKPGGLTNAVRDGAVKASAVLATPKGSRTEEQSRQPKTQGVVPSPKSTTPTPISKAKQFTSTDPVDIAVEEAIRMKDGEAPLPKPTPMAQLVRAVSLQESSGNPDAVHPMTSRGERAQGLMGILPSTSREIAKELGIDKYDLKDPETNMRFGEHYLKKLLDMFDGDQFLALTAYHSGPGRVKNLLKLHNATTLQEILPYLGPQGRAYASGVMSKLKKIDKYGSVKT